MQIRLIDLELKETTVSAAIRAPFNKAAHPDGTYRAFIHIYDTVAYFSAYCDDYEIRCCFTCATPCSFSQHSADMNLEWLITSALLFRGSQISEAEQSDVCTDIKSSTALQEGAHS